MKSYGIKPLSEGCDQGLGNLEPALEKKGLHRLCWKVKRPRAIIMECRECWVWVWELVT